MLTGSGNSRGIGFVAGSEGCGSSGTEGSCLGSVGMGASLGRPFEEGRVLACDIIRPLLEFTSKYCIEQTTRLIGINDSDPRFRQHSAGQDVFSKMLAHKCFNICGGPGPGKARDFSSFCIQDQKWNTRICNRWETDGNCSVSILAKRASNRNALAATENSGAIILQGPHQGAQ